MARCSDSGVDQLLLDLGPDVVDTRRTMETVSTRRCTTTPGGHQHVDDESIFQATVWPCVGHDIQLGVGHTAGEELEQLRFMMPLPQFQDVANRQAAKFAQSTPQKNNGLSMGKIGAQLRQWLWSRRDHRHIRAYLSTFLAILCEFVGDKPLHLRPFRGAALWSTIGMI
eukprot:235800-Pyramimonas_sp.AAC.1